jgi:hypothetical protein
MVLPAAVRRSDLNLLKTCSSGKIFAEHRAAAKKITGGPQAWN